MLKLSMIAMLLLVASVSIAQENYPHCSKMRTKTTNSAKSNLLNLSQIAQTEKYDVTFYELDLSMNNTSTDVSGTVAIYGKAVDPLDSVLLELFSTYVISSVEVNDVSTPFGRYASVVTIPVNLNIGEAFKVSITYSGTAPTAVTNPLGGAGLSNDNSPSWGNVVTWSLSEPFSAFEWFPCKQHLKDKADSSSFKITVPSTCMAGSNGMLENVVDLGAQKRYEWKHRHPIDYYLISVSIAEYIEYNVFANPVGSTGPVLIQNFIYNNPNCLPYFQDDIDETVDFMELYAELFGPYPFDNEKYGHCMAPISGGMEHQTMTTQGFFTNSLTAHELAHQWFGDHVTCASWADIWVNEGFASYAEYLMFENLYNMNLAAQDMLDRHQDIMSQNGGSVWVEDSLNEGAIFSGRLVYNKGAAIIHTLRHIVNNDEQFFNALRNYQIQFADSVAIGLDVKAVFEAETGLDLTEFFEQWYFGEGFPTYSAKYKMNGNDLMIEVNHTVSRPGITPTFTTPLNIRIDRTGVADTTLRINITGNSNLFIFPNFANFNNVTSLDYGNWVINQQGSIVNDPQLSSIKLDSENELILLYPNPTEGLVTIQNHFNETMELTVLDTRGRVIYNQTVDQSALIDLHDFASGNYLFELKGESGRIVRKVVKR